MNSRVLTPFLFLALLFSSLDSVFAFELLCKSSKPIQLLSRANPKFREFKFDPKEKPARESATFLDGASIEVSQGFCGQFHDHSEHQQYAVTLKFPVGYATPSKGSDKKWLSLTSKLLRDAGLCEKSKSSIAQWCTKIDQEIGTAKLLNDRGQVYSWQTTLYSDKFGNYIPLIISVVPGFPSHISVENEIHTPDSDRVE